MGNLSRFVEPVVLLLLQQKGRSYGYDLSAALQAHAVTDAEIERAALYRTLRQLERNGNVASEWVTDGSGPARRVYRLTPNGERHLDEWATVLEHVSQAMARFVTDARRSLVRRGTPGPSASRRRVGPSRTPRAFRKPTPTSRTEAG
jgi:PadR family transcriptional regulator, regulatory protein PadR